MSSILLLAFVVFATGKIKLVEENNKSYRVCLLTVPDRSKKLLKSLRFTAKMVSFLHFFLQKKLYFERM